MQLACFRALGPAGPLRERLPGHRAAGEPRLIGADASHAWLSVWCPVHGAWLDLDPDQRRRPRAVRHLGVAAATSASHPLRGVVLGGGAHELHVGVDVRRVLDPRPRFLAGRDPFGSMLVPRREPAASSFRGPRRSPSARRLLERVRRLRAGLRLCLARGGPLVEDDRRRRRRAAFLRPRSPALLSADDATCTYASGAVVTFTPPLVFPISTDTNWNFTISNGGQDCLALRGTSVGVELGGGREHGHGERERRAPASPSPAPTEPGS